MNRKDIERRLAEYIEALKSMETDQWVGQYSETATVEDPVSGPVHTGPDQLRAFFEGVRKNFRLLQIKPEMTVILPPEAAVKAEVFGITKTGVELTFDLIATYKFAEDGKVQQMRAFWDPVALAKKLK